MVIFHMGMCHIGIFNVGMCHIDIADADDTLDTADSVHCGPQGMVKHLNNVVCVSSVKRVHRIHDVHNAAAARFTACVATLGAFWTL